ncbi:MAG: hypothetical protein K2K60_05500 [Clostridia bacterium]|nr:hypothetical protein [Clostridia bacterium]
MKFKHSFHVFVDNFSVTYKHLLYRLVVMIIATGLYIAVLHSCVNGITDSAQFTGLIDAVKAFAKNFINGRQPALEEAVNNIKDSFAAVMDLISSKRTSITWCAVGAFLIFLVQKFFSGLGNYATAAVINDKMALRAKSPFIITLVRNLREASLYSLMYTPISVIYDLTFYIGLFFLVFKALFFVYLPLQLFLYVTLMVMAISFKMVLTSDWLPALIRGKMGSGKAFLYTFNRKNKNTFNIFSNFIVLVIIIFALNVMGVVFTFGAAALLTVPSSYVILVCFEFVNYYDREELKYFLDKNTIIKPEKEKAPTREEFFRGE